MKKIATNRKKGDELRREYDFSQMKGGIRGKCAERYQAGTNLVLLSPDVAAHFRSGRAVNNALRKLINAAGKSKRRAR